MRAVLNSERLNLWYCLPFSAGRGGHSEYRYLLVAGGRWLLYEYGHFGHRKCTVPYI